MLETTRTLIENQPILKWHSNARTGMPAEPKTLLKAAWFDMVVSPTHSSLIFARRWVEYHMSGVGSKQWKTRKPVPSPPHWDKIDQVVTYKFQINGKTQPNLQCALSLTPFTDFNLSTLLPSKELKINLMTFFKYEIGKKKRNGWKKLYV